MRSEYGANQALAQTQQVRRLVVQQPSSQNGFVCWVVRVACGAACGVVTIKVLQCLL